MARKVSIVRVPQDSDAPGTPAPSGGGEHRGPVAAVRRLLSDRLVRNVGWYGLAEFSNRLTRIVTTVVLARVLTPEDFGVTAIAITTFEILRIVAQTGVGQAVGRASDTELAAMCMTAHRVSWFICLATLVAQLLVGGLIAWATGRPDVFWMIACLSGVYLTLPFGQIQAHLVVRANRLHVLAGIAVVQVAADNLLTAGFALAGFGAWSVVLPKLLTAPVWVIGLRWAQTWKRDPAAGYAPVKPLVGFAATIIGSELIVAARMHLDKIVVGTILGVEGLGFYYFIFNAGIGFSLSLTQSLSASMYPHLAELADKPRALLARYDGMLLRAVLPCALVISLQAALALLYVPVVFGDRFAALAYLVAILCASAIMKPFYDSAAQLLRIVGLPHLELLASAVLTSFSLAALAVGLPLGLATGIMAMAGASFAIQAVFSVVVRRSVGDRLLSAAKHGPPHAPEFETAGAHP